MLRHTAGPLALALVLSACGSHEPAPVPAPQLPPIALRAVGDSVMYLEQSEALTMIDRPEDTLVIRSHHTAVIHVIRSAPDTLRAFYEHLLLRFETPSQTRNIDTRELIGPRFVLHEDEGRIETVVAPDLPDEIRQLTDLRRQFDDFFLRTGGHSLAIGEVWVDTVDLRGAEGEAGMERLTVTRFTVRGDTVIEGITARLIDYHSALEASLRTAPTTDGVLSSALVGEEEGTFVYSPERRVMLRRTRVGVLDGEIVIEGNLETVRFPQSFSYSGTVSLLPPSVPGAARRHRPVQPAPTPQP